MTNSLIKRLISGVAFLGCGALHAANVDVPSQTADVVVDASAVPSDFLSRSVTTLDGMRARATAAATATTPMPETYRQSGPALRNPLSASLRSSSDLFLWNLVALVHAQQTTLTFDLVDTNLTALVPLQPDVVSPVPLPPTLGLFISGALGLAALRRRAGDRRCERRSEKPVPGHLAPG